MSMVRTLRSSEGRKEVQPANAAGVSGPEAQSTTHTLAVVNAQLTKCCPAHFMFVLPMPHQSIQGTPKLYQHGNGRLAGRPESPLKSNCKTRARRGTVASADTTLVGRSAAAASAGPSSAACSAASSDSKALKAAGKRWRVPQ